MKRSPTKYDILTASKIGIEFEFFTEKSSILVCKEIGKILNKKIIIPTTVVPLGEKDSKGKYHSEFEPTATTFKLEKDFSGGRDMKELITGPVPYEEARLIIIKVNDWIKSNGWTDKKCAIHLNINFNPFMLKLKNEISHVDVLKLILSYDEEFVYSRFPERRNSVYARSINQVFPVNKFTFQNPYDTIDPNNYIVPDEKYYGINFTKRSKNYLEVRYLGGKAYEYRTQKILEILDYTILKIYYAIQNPEYTQQEVDKLKKMMVDQKSISETFSSPEKFLVKFPDINVFVDLKGQREVLKSYWTTIRESLFSAVIVAQMKEGVFNYDTDLAVSQLRNAKLKNAHNLTNFELFDCEVEGSFNEVMFFRCKIHDSRLMKCKLMELNEIHDSKVEHTSSFPSNGFFNCYINSPEQIIEGKIDGGVIRNAILGQNVDISKRTLIVETGEEKGAVKIDSKHDKDSVQTPPADRMGIYKKIDSINNDKR